MCFKCLIAACCLLTTGLAAKQDSTDIPLPEILVKGDRWQTFNAGASRLTFDSLSLAVNHPGTIGELLRKEAGLSARMTGLYALNTLSLRGTGSGHTAVWWNGFNLQNAMNGVQDFALLPVAMTDEVMLQYGGMGALTGSGVLGGGIFLRNKQDNRSGWHGNAGLSGGSFGSAAQWLTLQTNFKKYSHRIRAFHHQSKGDFPFKDLSAIGNPVRKLENNAAETFAVIQEHYLKLSETHRLQVIGWWQQSQRQIPPAMTEANQEAYQEDRSLRLTAQQTVNWQKISLKNRVAMFSEFLRFGSRVLQPSDSKALTWQVESDAEIPVHPKHLIRAGVFASRMEAIVAAYGEKVFQNRWSAMASWKYDHSAAFSAVLNLRQEMPGQGKAPFTPALGWQWKWSEQWTCKGSVNRNYRLPTFNDLYWNESYATGNPDLAPEKGWSEELSWTFSNTHGSLPMEWSATIYSLQVKDWIIWLPRDNIWKPGNLSAVWSTGTEITAKCHFTVRKLNFKPHVRYMLTRSVNFAVEDQQLSQGLNKQLPYVPLHQGVSGVKVSIGNWYGEYHHQWVGKRFTNFDNSDAIAAYQTGTWTAGTSFRCCRLTMVCQLTVDNIWNTVYQSVAWRPMPGRSWQIQCKTDF